MEIDELFIKCINKLNSPKILAESLLFCRTHSAFRASVRMGISGQVVETYPLLRFVLECASYAFFIFNEFKNHPTLSSSNLKNENEIPSRSSIWLNRSKSDESRKLLRKTFQYKNILSELREEIPSEAGIFEHLYESTIDYGAHPNPQGLLINLRVNDSDSTRDYNTVYLQDDSSQLRLCLKHCSEVGIMALIFFKHIFVKEANFSDFLKEIEKLKKLHGKAFHS